MYEKEFSLTDGTVLSSKQVNEINAKAIEGAVRLLAAQTTKTANRSVAKR